MAGMLRFLPLSFFLLLMMVVVWLSEDPEAMRPNRVGMPLPALGLTAVVGESMDIAPLMGKPFIVNIFASWCTPCQMEHPHLVALAEAGVPIVGIAWRDKPEQVRSWLEKHGNPYRMVGVDPSETVGVRLGMTGVPESYLVDSAGIIRERHAGPLTPDWIKKLIVPHIPEIAEAFP